MKMKEFLRDYLTFTRKDRIGIIVILSIILGVFFLPKAISRASSKPGTHPDTSWIAAVKRLEQKDSATDNREYAENNSSNYQYDRNAGHKEYQIKGELFYFDPNTISADDWQKLGLRDKTIHTIQNYLSKGGRFRKPEDLQRVYGLFPDEFERLAPYIRIEATEKEITNTSFEKNAQQTPKTYPPRFSIVEINSADTTSFIALPGIGSKLAMRIVNFRNKLGGFYSIEQVGETFGLPDSTFQKIKQYLRVETSSVKKININTASADELKTHPYIKWPVASPVIAYRNEHGPFAKLEDLKKVMAVTDEIYQKVAPYLEVH